MQAIKPTQVRLYLNEDSMSWELIHAAEERLGREKPLMKRYGELLAYR